MELDNTPMLIYTAISIIIFFSWTFTEEIDRITKATTNRYLLALAALLILITRYNSSDIFTFITHLISVAVICHVGVMMLTIRMSTLLVGVIIMIIVATLLNIVNLTFLSNYVSNLLFILIVVMALKKIKYENT